MNVLAFDTCFDACSAAVRVGATGEVFARRTLMRRGHAEAVVPMIAEVMAASGLAFEDLDRIAVTHGPGTFTGTRIGIAAAHGFAVSHGTAVVTQSSLATVARAVWAALGPDATYDGVAVLRDAKRGRVFIEIVAADAAAIAGPALVTDAAARDHLAGRRLFAVGSAAGRIIEGGGDELATVSSAWPQSPPDGIDQPDSRFLLDVALESTPVDRPVPLYLRPPDATPSQASPIARLEPGTTGGSVDI